MADKTHVDKAVNQFFDCRDYRVHQGSFSLGILQVDSSFFQEQRFYYRVICHARCCHQGRGAKDVRFVRIRPAIEQQVDNVDRVIIRMVMGIFEDNFDEVMEKRMVHIVEKHRRIR